MTVAPGNCADDGLYIPLTARIQRDLGVGGLLAWQISKDRQKQRKRAYGNNPARTVIQSRGEIPDPRSAWVGDFALSTV